jgi:hypothetical protein
MKRNLPNFLLAILYGAVWMVPADLPAAETPMEVLSGRKWSLYPGYEFPGAKGTSRLETIDGRDGLVVTYDFSGGGAYVISGTMVDIPDGTKEIRADIRADREIKVMVRLEDSAKQTHQYQLRYETPGEWQMLSLALGQPAKGSFGGPKDGIIHFPILKFSIGVEKGKTTMEPGEMTVTAIRIFE